MIYGIMGLSLFNRGPAMDVKTSLLQKHEVAKMLGIGLNALNHLQKNHPDFPEPLNLITYAGGKIPLYWRARIIGWAKRHNWRVYE